MPTLECRLLGASIACYAVKNGAIDSKNPNLIALGLMPGTSPTVFVDGKDEINAGFVGLTSDDWIVLALRGTLPPFTGDLFAWIRDWLQDFEAGPTDWIVGGSVFGQVETGFATAVQSVWKDAASAIASLQPLTRKGILVTGHSKGAAMTALAASLLKHDYPTVLVENCCFAAPLTCDETFEKNYDALGLRPFTVRYQNMKDVVPYLPWWPIFTLLSAAERRMNKSCDNAAIVQDAWPTAVANIYKPIGILRYLGPNCVVEYGQVAEHDAWAAMKTALEDLEFSEIAAAHHASGRYYTCVCG